MTSSPNLDPRTVASFGDEWQRFDQQAMAPAEAERVFGDYFAIFPWQQLPPAAEGFDMGCGSGRWARFVAPRVGQLHCIDPSSALAVARQALAEQPNVQFHQASVAASGLQPNSQDFGYSLGVLHHVPDTAAAIRSCTELLKPGAPLLLYLYYAFDNRPRWFRWLWQLSNTARLLIRRLPPRPKQLITDMIALTLYWPLARFAALAETAGLPVGAFPLSYYRRCSIYTMRTDARDRFGTPLEQRFTRAQIRQMCTAAGLVNLLFSPRAPFWCVVGFKAG
jgi:SAM-dependent methyltransferase